MDPESLINFLVERQLRGERDSRDLVGEFEESEKELFDFLAGCGFGGREEILRFLAAEQGRDFVDLSGAEFGPALLAAVDADTARIFESLPVEVSENRIKVCMVDPLDGHAVAQLSVRLGKTIEVAIADPDQVRRKLKEFLGSNRPAVDTGPVAASLGGTAVAPHGETSVAGGKGSPWMTSFAVLALAATATSAVYVSRSRKIEEWKNLVERNEGLLRQSEAMRRGNETVVLQIENEIEALEKLLVKKEVETIRVDALEKDLRELRGKMEALDKILDGLDSSPGAESQQAASP